MWKMIIFRWKMITFMTRFNSGTPACTQPQLYYTKCKSAYRSRSRGKNQILNFRVCNAPQFLSEIKYSYYQIITRYNESIARTTNKASLLPIKWASDAVKCSFGWERCFVTSIESTFLEAIFFRKPTWINEIHSMRAKLWKVWQKFLQGWVGKIKSDMNFWFSTCLRWIIYIGYIFSICSMVSVHGKNQLHILRPCDTNIARI